ncbi:MAG: hypothetical protein AB8U16_01960 [Rickettsiales endosymbiont of Dermacentor nuttalli]
MPHSITALSHFITSPFKTRNSDTEESIYRTINSPVDSTHKPEDSSIQIQTHILFIALVVNTRYLTHCQH